MNVTRKYAITLLYFADIPPI